MNDYQNKIMNNPRIDYAPSTPGCDRKLSSLEERSKQLQHEFDTLEQVIVQLWDKLRPFLVDDRPGTDDCVPRPEQQHSPMWRELDQATARVCHNRIVLAQLLDRIES